jgi:hypothetical protein
MWVNAKEREKNKEKHVNGAMFLTHTNWIFSVTVQLENDWSCDSSLSCVNLIRGFSCSGPL